MPAFIRMHTKHQLNINLGWDLHLAPLSVITRHAISATWCLRPTAIHASVLPASLDITEPKLKASAVGADPCHRSLLLFLSPLLTGGRCGVFSLETTVEPAVDFPQISVVMECIVMKGNKVRMGNANIGRLQNLLHVVTLADFLNIARMMRYSRNRLWRVVLFIGLLCGECWGRRKNSASIDTVKMSRLRNWIEYLRLRERMDRKVINAFMRNRFLRMLSQWSSGNHLMDSLSIGQSQLLSLEILVSYLSCLNIYVLTAVN